MSSACLNDLNSFQTCTNYPVVEAGKWAFPTLAKPAAYILYVPGKCPSDYISTSPANVNFFTLIDKRYNQPIFTMWASVKHTIANALRSDAQILQDHSLGEADFSSQEDNDASLDASLYGGKKRPDFRSCCLDAQKDANYSGTGMSRGHLVAMADMGLFNCGRDDCSFGTFTTCNTSPQNQVHNTLWSYIEATGRICATNYSSVCIYTGPLFRDGGKYCMNKTNCTGNACDRLLNPHPKSALIDWYSNPKYYKTCAGTNAVPIPTDFYKVMCVKHGKDIQVFCIVMAQRLPGRPEQNGEIVATGADAWEMITDNLPDLKFPDEISDNITEWDWNVIPGKEHCPFTPTPEPEPEPEPELAFNSYRLNQPNYRTRVGIEKSKNSGPLIFLCILLLILFIILICLLCSKDI